MKHFKPLWVLVAGMVLYAIGAAMLFPSIQSQQTSLISATNSILAGAPTPVANTFWHITDAETMTLIGFSIAYFAALLFYVGKLFLKTR